MAITELLQREPQFVPLQISTPLGQAPALDNALVHWLDAGASSFQEPFLRESLQLCLSKPFNKLFRPCCPVSELPRIVEHDPAVEIAGFIFHTSRCGSTLLCQMLAQDPEIIVLPEPEPLDQLLRLGRTQAQHNLAIIRALVLAMARKRDANAKRCIIKLDSWHGEFAPVLRAAFPEVPWVALYREPSEVLASNIKVPSTQMIPGTVAHLPAGMSMIEALQMPMQRYAAVKLGLIYDALWQMTADPRTRLVNYCALPAPGLDTVLQHFKISTDPIRTARMLSVCGRDAKKPSQTFKADGAEKRAYLDADAKADCAALLEPIYQRLERYRNDQR